MLVTDTDLEISRRLELCRLQGNSMVQACELCLYHGKATIPRNYIQPAVGNVGEPARRFLCQRYQFDIRVGV